MKLREFNFKILHGSLPCNSNLKRWDLRTTDKFNVCQESQSIKYLLWECDYVKSLWSIVDKVCDFEITYGEIVGIEDCCKQHGVLINTGVFPCLQRMVFTIFRRQENIKQYYDTVLQE